MKLILPRAVRDNCPYLKPLGPSLILLAMLLFAGCQTALPPRPETPARTDDLIIVDGQRFHTGTRIVTWEEAAGYNAYHFKPTELAGKANHGARRIPSAEGEEGWVDREEPWDLPALQSYVDQFVLHYDSEGFSRRCFEVLQRRGLSAHFLLDLDGTIYQTLDLRERAYHAGSANSRSIGIEIANVGAYGLEEKNEWDEWIALDEENTPFVKIPEALGDPQLYHPDFVARPSRPAQVTGEINGRALRQYDFTPEQYAALIKLTAALHRVFPLITLDQPRDPFGQPIHEKLPDELIEHYQGLIGHYHLQEIKIDPGPAFDWDQLIEGAQQELQSQRVTQ